MGAAALSVITCSYLAQAYERLAQDRDRFTFEVGNEPMPAAFERTREIYALDIEATQSLIPAAYLVPIVLVVALVIVRLRLGVGSLWSWIVLTLAGLTGAGGSAIIQTASIDSASTPSSGVSEASLLGLGITLCYVAVIFLIGWLVGTTVGMLRYRRTTA